MVMFLLVVYFHNIYIVIDLVFQILSYLKTNNTLKKIIRLTCDYIR